MYEKYLVESEDANKVASLPVNFQVCVSIEFLRALIMELPDEVTKNCNYVTGYLSKGLQSVLFKPTIG